MQERLFDLLFGAQLQDIPAVGALDDREFDLGEEWQPRDGGVFEIPA